MTALARTDTSIVGRWWWTVDRWTLAALITLMGAGALLALAASPGVAERIGLNPYYFVRNQAVYLAMALMAMLAVSMLSARGVRRLAVAMLAGGLVLTAATPFLGSDIKGASRWLALAGFSIQPSEFVKPALAVVTAALFAQRRLDGRFPGYAIGTAIFVLFVFLLLRQPDVGMALVAASVWAIQIFLAGLPMAFVGAIAGLFLAAAVVSYFAFSHVQGRIDRFLDPASGDTYQITQSLEAIRNGGLLGVGPGEGAIKARIPDAHADFVFAVAGEEFGLIACLALIGIFAFVALRGFARVFREDDLFALMAVTGLLSQFSLQAIINISSTINLIPTKGMTLPFVSYGGSSALALALGMGMMLALTRDRPGRGGGP